MTSGGLYQSQRAMRSLREQALQRGVIAVLDVGTSKVTCLVLRIDGAARGVRNGGVGSMGGQPSFRVIGVGTTMSRGVRFGEVNAMPETERAIRTAVQTAQKMADTRVDHVIASFAGAAPRSYGVDGTVALEESVVSEHEISRVLASCHMPETGEGRHVMHAQPVNFALDHRSGLVDPRGQLGQTLTVDMHLLTVDATAVANLAYCIKRCDLELAGLTTSAYAAGLSALVEDEQELGAACIDFGGGTTSLSIFLKKHMICADAVAMGGDHVTRDIHQGLNIPLTDAERLKTLHGGVEPTGMDDREVIELGGDSGDWHHDRRRATRAELIGIIRPRVEEILEEVKARLDAAHFGYLPSQQIVLTGGASQIPGLDGLASRILGQQVRLGRPLRVAGMPQAITGPGFSAAVGLTLFAAHPQDEFWHFQMPSQGFGGRSLARAMTWFRQNW
ncbi:MAG: cell division protein FtsA [Rhodobacteraceae bacterium]|nr:cell division protein FtsA [Paracoccaceae bacterium]